MVLFCGFKKSLREFIIDDCQTNNNQRVVIKSQYYKVDRNIFINKQLPSSRQYFSHYPGILRGHITIFSHINI